MDESEAGKKLSEDGHPLVDAFIEYVTRELNEDALYSYELKSAVVGYIERIGSEPLIVMSREKCLEIIKKRNRIDNNLDDDEDEDLRAIEEFEYNVLQAWEGKGTPVFLTTIEEIEYLL